ncbi:MAG: agmatine deiminase family protein [Pseudomonadota bacterium]
MMPAPKPRLRAEWESQSGVLMAWPHEGTDWRDNLAEVQSVYVRIAVEITRRQPLLMLVPDSARCHRIRGQVAAAGGRADALCCVDCAYDDTWTRDYGPLAVDAAGGTRLVDFRFNGWGGKFDARQDDAVNAILQERDVRAPASLHRSCLVMEGGALETDGRGTLLATLGSVVDESRNPGLSRLQLEILLRQELGIERFLWLTRGTLSGDDTGGHIDTLARFADSRTIVHVTVPAEDPDHAEVRAMIEQLESLRDPHGTPYRLVALPPAGVHRDPDGRRLPATYANFLIINGAVLAPLYGVPQDAAALQVLRSVFPQRQVVGVDCRALIRQNGSLHCATLQLPAGVSVC